MNKQIIEQMNDWQSEQRFEVCVSGHFFMFVCKEHPNITPGQINHFWKLILSHHFHQPFLSTSTLLQPHLVMYYISFFISLSSPQNKKKIKWPNQWITLTWKEGLIYLLPTKTQGKNVVLAEHFVSQILFWIVFWLRRN